eukprot:773897-Prorocentrum_minimum.AAC.3
MPRRPRSCDSNVSDGDLGASLLQALQAAGGQLSRQAVCAAAATVNGGSCLAFWSADTSPSGCTAEELVGPGQVSQQRLTMVQIFMDALDVCVADDADGGARAPSPTAQAPTAEAPATAAPGPTAAADPPTPLSISDTPAPTAEAPTPGFASAMSSSAAASSPGSETAALVTVGLLVLGTLRAW